MSNYILSTTYLYISTISPLKSGYRTSRQFRYFPDETVSDSERSCLAPRARNCVRLEGDTTAHAGKSLRLGRISDFQ